MRSINSRVNTTINPRSGRLEKHLRVLLETGFFHGHGRVCEEPADKVPLHLGKRKSGLIRDPCTREPRKISRESNQLLGGTACSFAASVLSIVQFLNCDHIWGGQFHQGMYQNINNPNYGTPRTMAI